MRRILKARKEAQRLLKERGTHSAPVDVHSIAERFARIVKSPLEPEVSGVLVPQEKGNWIIIVNESHHPVRQRFTIAHELGHLLLHGYKTPHADRRFRFRDARSSEGSAIEEIQANQFAAELLMPRELIIKAAIETIGFQVFDYVSSQDTEFSEGLAALAKEYEVSQQAIAIRLSSIFA